MLEIILIVLKIVLAIIELAKIIAKMFNKRGK